MARRIWMGLQEGQERLARRIVGAQQEIHEAIDEVPPIVFQRQPPFEVEAHGFLIEAVVMLELRDGLGKFLPLTRAQPFHPPPRLIRHLI